MERRLKRNLSKFRPDGGWEYPLIAEVVRDVGIEEVEVYIGRQ